MDLVSTMTFILNDINSFKQFFGTFNLLKRYVFQELWVYYFHQNQVVVFHLILLFRDVKVRVTLIPSMSALSSYRYSTP